MELGICDERLPMRLGLIGVAFGACLIGESCAAGPQQLERTDLPSVIADGQGQGLHVLSKDELEKVLIGHSVTSEWVTTPHVESFLPGGEYRRSGHGNVLFRGHYSIRQNAVCIFLASVPERCSIFASDRQGHYLRKGIGHGSIWEPIRIHKMITVTVH